MLGSKKIMNKISDRYSFPGIFLLVILVRFIGAILINNESTYAFFAFLTIIFAAPSSFIVVVILKFDSAFINTITSCISAINYRLFQEYGYLLSVTEIIIIFIGIIQWFIVGLFFDIISGKLERKSKI